MIVLIMDKRLYDCVNILSNSFPKELSNEFNNIIEILPLEEKIINHFYKNYTIDNLISGDSSIILKLNNDIIKIPYRIYFNEPQKTRNLSDIQNDILYCIYSRHYNGFIRQKNIEKIKDNKNYWITPFFIQLFGEYIYEIMEIFNEYLNMNMDNCIKFINENSEYWRKIENRMISYWNEFYRDKYPKYKKYLGKEIIAKINKEKNNSARHYFA